MTSTEQFVFLLKDIAVNGKGTIREIAARTGMSASDVSRRIQNNGPANLKPEYQFFIMRDFKCWELSGVGRTRYQEILREEAEKAEADKGKGI